GVFDCVRGLDQFGLHPDAVRRQLPLFLCDLGPPGLDLLKPKLVPHVKLSGLIGVEIARLFSGAALRGCTAWTARFASAAVLRRVGTDNWRCRSCAWGVRLRQTSL